MISVIKKFYLMTEFLDLQQFVKEVFFGLNS